VAEVICRQMGWVRGRLVELSIVTDAPCTRQIWMDNMNCPTWPSTETHIEKCTHNDHTNYTDATYPVGSWKWGTNNNACTHAKDIGVGCDMWTEVVDDGNPLVVAHLRVVDWNPSLPNPDPLKTPRSPGTKGNA